MNTSFTGDRNRETEKTIYFYTPPHYYLDNFSAYAVKLWGKTFSTSEHAYQWKKYIEVDPALAEEILNAANPHQVKRIADAHTNESTDAFHEHKVAIMEEIIRAKVHQHEKVREKLMATGDKELIDNNPTDSFWGIGPDGNGQNMLGKLWIKIRTELRDSAV